METLLFENRFGKEKKTKNIFTGCNLGIGKGMVGKGMVGKGMVGKGMVGRGMVGGGMVGGGMVHFR